MGDEERKKNEVDESRKEGANFGASVLFNVYSFETRPTRAVNMAAIAKRERDASSRLARLRTEIIREISLVIKLNHSSRKRENSLGVRSREIRDASRCENKHDRDLANCLPSRL